MTLEESTNIRLSSFIEHRWAEAKEELKRVDSAFVNAFSAYDTLTDRGLWLPDNLLTPSRRLSKRWYMLLESTVELIRQIDRLNLTISKTQTAQNRREFIYYWDIWVEAAYSLCEKVERVIERSCNVHRMAQHRRRYFVDQVEEHVKHKISSFRQALVHGADDPKRGGRGITAQANTEDGLWEGLVMSNPQDLSPFWLESAEHPVPEYVRGIPNATRTRLEELGNILTTLDLEIRAITSSRYDPKIYS